MITEKYTILLGSQSPRRKELLAAAGFTFTLEVRPIEEVFDQKMNPYQVAEYLAIQKSKAFDPTQLSENQILLTADSVVIKDDVIYGKPVDLQDAKRMIREFSGSKHTVVTGVSLLSNKKQYSFSSISDVYFEALTEAEIDYYVDTFKPLDKAGGYGIQEWIGFSKIKRIEGTFANIMGLPVSDVYRAIQDHF